MTQEYKEIATISLYLYPPLGTNVSRAGVPSTPLPALTQTHENNLRDSFLLSFFYTKGLDSIYTLLL